jgi:hypothetical protein
MIAKRILIIASSAAALSLIGCGSSSSKPSTTQTVGAAGATLKAGVATLTIPAGAVAANTVVTLREGEVRQSGRHSRIEVEPRGLALASPGQLSVKIDDSNVKIRMVDDSGGLHQVEVEDRNHHQFKTSLSHLGEIEVELEHGLTCAPACGATQECDDGVCKAHDESEHALVCAEVCASTQECDDGVCKAHDEMEHDATTGLAACTPGCATGLECDNGICKPHGGTP